MEITDLIWADGLSVTCMTQLVVISSAVLLDRLVSNWLVSSLRSLLNDVYICMYHIFKIRAQVILSCNREPHSKIIYGSSACS